MKMNFSRLGLPLLTFLLIFGLHKAEAAMMIDDFTEYMWVQNKESGSTPLHSNLGDIDRTLETTESTNIIVLDGILALGSDGDIAGTMSVLYDFGSSGIDLDDRAVALLFNAYVVDGDVNLKFIAKDAGNNRSEFVMNNLTKGEHRIGFSEFSGSEDAFSQLTSLELIFSGDPGWDAALVGGIMAVPEPSSFALLAIGLLALTGVGRKRFASLHA